MPKYRKKPVVIDAIQVPPVGQRDNGFMEFLACDREVNIDGDGNISIKTLEGTMQANVGDWLIKGVQGEMYPCKPDIFEATYELADAAE